MSKQAESHFDALAAEWDDNPVRVELAKAVSTKILAEVNDTAELDALDYGCGTGLVSLFVASHVKSLTCADSSKAMLEVLDEKISASGLENAIARRLDLETEPPPNARFGLIFTSMAMHHIADVKRVLQGFFTILRPGGTLCIADLDSEPGTFHGSHAEEAGVHHNGFDRGELKELLSSVGFSGARDETVYTIRKPIEKDEWGEFPVFFIVANR